MIWSKSSESLVQVRVLVVAKKRVHKEEKKAGKGGGRDVSGGLGKAGLPSALTDQS